MILDFIRNKIVEVEPLADGNVTVYWRLRDSLQSVEITLKFQPPDLVITEAKADVKPLLHGQSASAQALIQKVEGVRVGPGLRKIVSGLLSGSEGCELLTRAVLESSNAVILHFTRYTLQPGDDIEGDAKIAAARANLKFNPRMIGNCVVYGPGSPVMQGVEQ